jgi:hypothetical protein
MEVFVDVMQCRRLISSGRFGQRTAVDSNEKFIHGFWNYGFICSGLLFILAVLFSEPAS